MPSAPTPTPPPQIPLVVAVTGHRDLHPEDRAAGSALRRTVEGALRSLQTAHPQMPLLVLSGMADGADQLVAEVALAVGCEVIACLPKPEPEYLAELSAPAQEGLRELRARCRRVIVVPPEGSDPAPDDAAAYVTIGRFLVRHANVLLAVWDGEDTQKRGGTKHVIDMMVGTAPRAELLDLSDEAEAGHVIHVPAGRRSGQRLTDASETGVRTILAAGGGSGAVYRRVFSHIGRLNTELASAHARSPGAATAVRRDLIGDTEESTWAPAADLLDGQAHVDCLATDASRKTTNSLRTLTTLAGATGVSFLLYTDLVHHRPVFLLLYLAMLCATSWYLIKRVQRMDRKNRYLDYRALAEGLRVAVFWRLAGVSSSVADHYLDTSAGELNWIRSALRTWCLMSKSEHAPADAPADHARFDAVRTQWIDAQAAWFRSTSVKRRQARDLLDRAKRVLLGLAVACSIALAVMTLAVLPRESLGEFFRHLVLDHEASASQWLQLGAGLLLLAVTLCVAWAESRAYREEAQEFDRMALLFGRASTAASSMRAADPTEFRNLVGILGREALRENAEWLLLHRERPLTAQLG